MSSPSRKQRSSSNSNDNKDGGGGRRSGGGPAPFLMKTHQMVEDEAGDEVISWGENGTSFVVWKPVEFARDLLPLHFKHNNFSSFVRQLNTYGFRKVVPERWEFANDNFRRGEPGRLCDIRRRKAPPNPSSANKSSTAKNIVTPTSTSTSLDSTSSPPPPPPPPLPPPPSQQFLDLSNENEKLKKDNQILSKELAQAKQQCEQLLRLLSAYVNSNDINAGLLMKEAPRVGMEVEREEAKKKMEGAVEAAKEAKDEGNNVACLKLFGVLLSVTNGGRKRGRCEEGGGGGRPVKVCFGGGSPWMGMSSPVGESSKVCN